MNWTGGRLNRHAKSHGNDKIKAQRTFFAQVSRDRNRSHPPAEIEIPLESSQLEIPKTHQNEHKLSFPDHSRHSSQSSSYFQQHLPRGSETKSHYSVKDQSSVHDRPFTTKLLNPSTADIEVSRGNRLERGVRKSATANETPTTIDEMKKKFLDQSDWLGLSTCRPANLSFAPAGDVAKIGRHRRSTQLTVQDNRNRHPNKNDQQHNINAVTGKRKRPEHEQHFSRLNAKGHASGSDHGTSGRVLEDPNRRFYVRIDDEADQDITSIGLIPLEDARKFQNFDEVQKEYLESKEEKGSALGIGDSGIKYASKVSAVEKAQSKGSQDSDSGRPEIATRGPQRKFALDVSIPLTEPGTSPKHIGNHDTKRIRLTSTLDADASRPVGPTFSAKEFRVVQPKDLATLNFQEAGIATRDFAFPPQSLKGRHKIGVAELEDAADAINHTWLRNFAHVPKEVYPSPKNTNTSRADESPVQNFFQPHDSRKNPTGVRHRVRLQLDECFERELEGINKKDDNTYPESPMRDVTREQFSGAILSPHFTHTIKSDKTLQRSNPVPFIRELNDTQNGKNGSVNSKDVGSVIDHHHEVRKRSFTETFLDLPTVSHQSAISLPPQVYLMTPPPKREQRPWVYDRTSSLYSRSSSFLN